MVDVTRTQNCDSAGLSVLVRAHKRALEEGGELRLVMPAHGAVFRIFTLTGLYRFIPRFGSLQEALLQRPAAAIRPSRPHPSEGIRRPAHQPGSPDAEGGPVADTRAAAFPDLAVANALSTTVTGAHAGR